jgi:LysR family transcriptional regulator, glycine cleavage system transcriptional activator
MTGAEPIAASPRRRRRAPPAAKSLRRLPLGSLRVFVAVAQHLHFTRAADALGVTAGAASLQIRSLEEYLRRPLFRRNGRSVSLTREGAALLPRVQYALGELERALDDSREVGSGGPLRVSMLGSFLNHWLLPRLPELRTRYPAIDLHIDTSVALVDFVREDQHAAIRLGTGDWPNVLSEKLLDEWLVPVCTPVLHARNGPVRDAKDLARYTLVHSTSEPWTEWLLADRLRGAAAAPYAGASFDDSSAVVRYALRGYGLALARWSLVADEVSSGALVIASPTPVRHARAYWLVCPQRVQSLQAFMDFRDWLRAEMHAFPLPPGAQAESTTAPSHRLRRITKQA